MLQDGRSHRVSRNRQGVVPRLIPGEKQTLQLYLSRPVIIQAADLRNLIHPDHPNTIPVAAQCAQAAEGFRIGHLGFKSGS